MTELWLQLRESITGLLCALTLRSTSHIAFPAPRQRAPIQEYPLPAGPFNVIGLDLMQFPQSTQGPAYTLVCVNHLSHCVVFAPLCKKSTVAVAHVLVSHSVCPNTTPQALTQLLKPSSLTVAQSLRIRSSLIFVPSIK